MASGQDRRISISVSLPLSFCRALDKHARELREPRSVLIERLLRKALQAERNNHRTSKAPGTAHVQ